MMGFDNQEESHLYASQEHMETLLLDDDPSPASFPAAADADAARFSDPLSLPFAEISTDDYDYPPSSSPQSIFQPPNPSLNLNSSSFQSILEPPSYADAVFRSFDRDLINGHDRASLDEPSTSPVSPSRSEYIRISVSDPQKELELSNSLVPGSNTYYTYLVTTRTNLKEFGGSEFSVRRRFREVVSLSDRLSESYRGFFIPLRPDKSVVESKVMQEGEFVEYRRDALEKYLRRLAVHPVIRRSEELTVFLRVEGKVFEGESRDVVPVQPVGKGGGGGGRDLLWMFKELKQSVSYDWGGTKPLVVEEDKEFLERKDKLQEFELQLSSVSQQAESLVKAQQDIGETMGGLGLAFVKLTKFETEEAMYNSQRVRAADMKNVATAAVKASRLYRELNAQTVKHLAKLHEYLGVMLAVNNAFTDRSNALLTVQTLLSELLSLNSRIEKLEVASSKIFGGDRKRILKIEELKETVRVTEDAKSCAVKEYEQIKENIKNELERLDKERHNDFLSMLKGFVVNQRLMHFNRQDTQRRWLMCGKWSQRKQVDTQKIVADINS
ncbi:hypothetical protein RHGRI_027672 [Rhododendron griersonianum]|uniref:PX domain-containing protein n=1 Tax=Rhododendron griersonianum TaxID=479676 RepID=A0AAV6IXN1_9ERIC|nr:hypothetical protein RHGRI_027672 [Rhododendron griersonianum]